VTRNSRSSFRSAAIAAAAAFSLAGCALSADGYTDEDLAGKSTAPDKALVKALMTGLGAVDGSRKPITYKPRSPLVVPPSRTLPAPETGETKVATVEEWPDRDGKEAERIRRIREADPDRSRTLAASERLSGKVWTPEELARYKVKGAGHKNREEERFKTLRDSEDGRRLSRKELGKTVDFDKAKKGDTVARTRLTDPPAAYRTPASTAPMPEGEKDDGKKKKVTVMDRAIGGYRHNN